MTSQPLNIMPILIVALLLIVLLPLMFMAAAMSGMMGGWPWLVMLVVGAVVGTARLAGALLGGYLRR